MKITYTIFLLMVLLFGGEGNLFAQPRKPATTNKPDSGSTSRPESHVKNEDKRDMLSKKLQERRKELKQESGKEHKVSNQGNRRSKF